MKNPKKIEQGLKIAKIAAAKRAESGLSPRARHDEKIMLVLWFLGRFGFSTEPLLSFLTDDKTNRLISSLLKKKLITFDLCWLNFLGVGGISKIYKLTESGFDVLGCGENESHRKNYFNKVRRLGQKNFKNDLFSQFFAIEHFLNSDECADRSRFGLVSAFTQDTGTKNKKVADFEIYTMDEDGEENGRAHFEIETSPKSGMELDEFIQRIDWLFSEERFQEDSVLFPNLVNVYVAGKAATARYTEAFSEEATYNAIVVDNGTRRRSKAGRRSLNEVTPHRVFVHQIPDWLNPAARGLGKTKSKTI